MMTDTIHIGSPGASGYTGAELVRLLAGHPHARIELMTAERHTLGTDQLRAEHQQPVAAARRRRAIRPPACGRPPASA
jgi:N-acetyl-gamma-glutamylphosphate reductase